MKKQNRTERKSDIAFHKFSALIMLAMFFVCLAMFFADGMDSGYITLMIISAVMSILCFAVWKRNSCMSESEYEDRRKMQSCELKQKVSRPRKRRHSTFLILGGLAWLISDILKDSKRYGGRKTDYMPGITKDRYH